MCFNGALYFTEHSEGTSAQYRKPEWVTRMEELKTAMQGRTDGDPHNLSDVSSAQKLTPVSQSNTVEADDQPQRSTAGPFSLVNISAGVKKRLAQTLGVPSCDVPSRSLSVGLNSLPTSVSSCTSSESLAINSSISQDSLNAVRYSRSEVDPSELASVSIVGSSSDASNTVSSRTDKTGLASSSVSLGDLSMGSDSVFVSETETISSDISRLNDSLYQNTLLNTIYGTNATKSVPHNIGGKHVHFDVDKAEVSDSRDNFAQSVLTDYLTSHRNSISQFIKSLSHESPETETPRANIGQSDSTTYQSFMPINLSCSSYSTVALEAGVGAKEKPMVDSINDIVTPLPSKDGSAVKDEEESNAPSEVAAATLMAQPRMVTQVPMFGRDIASAPTTPLLSRRTSDVKASTTFVSKGIINISNKVGTSESCTASPVTTPVLGRKLFSRGSISRIPKLAVKAVFGDKNVEKDRYRASRSTSAPCTPLMSPESVRRNSRIPVRDSSFPSSDDLRSDLSIKLSGSDKLNRTDTSRNKVMRSASIPCRYSRATSVETISSAAKRVNAPLSVRERVRSIVNSPLSPKIRRSPSKLRSPVPDSTAEKVLEADVKSPLTRRKSSLTRTQSMAEPRSSPVRSKKSSQSPPILSQNIESKSISNNKSTSRPNIAAKPIQGKILMAKKSSPVSAHNMENRTPTDEKVSNNLLQNKKTDVQISNQVPETIKSVISTEIENVDVVREPNIAPIIENKKSLDTVTDSVAEVLPTDVGETPSNSVVPLSFQEKDSKAFSSKMTWVPSTMKNTDCSNTLTSPQSCASSEKSGSVSPTDTLKLPSSADSATLPSDIVTNGSNFMSPPTSKKTIDASGFIFPPATTTNHTFTSFTKHTQFECPAPIIKRENSKTLSCVMPHSKSIDEDCFDSLTSRFTDLMSKDNIMEQVSTKRPEYKPSASILEILNTDVYFKKEPKGLIDTLIQTPFFEDKYILSVRRKSSCNYGLPRADSLEEFLMLESECMTGRK